MDWAIEASNNDLIGNPMFNLGLPVVGNTTRRKQTDRGIECKDGEYANWNHGALIVSHSPRHKDTLDKPRCRPMPTRLTDVKRACL